MNNLKNVYDDGNIPETDLPKDAGITHAQNNVQNNAQNDTQNNAQNDTQSNVQNGTQNNVQNNSQNNAKDKESDSHYCQNRVVTPAEPLPESSRPRKDGPGGN